MSERSVVHATFTIERTYPASPARVFAAWADPKIKSRWFGTPDDDTGTRQFEFRVGGREYSAGTAPNGANYTFDVLYQDIVPDQRIIYTYQMELDGQRISVSVASIELKPAGSGTHMKVTELGAYLDGLDTSAQREQGTNWLMDKLGEELTRQMAE